MLLFGRAAARSGHEPGLNVKPVRAEKPAQLRLRVAGAVPGAELLDVLEVGRWRGRRSRRFGAVEEVGVDGRGDDAVGGEQLGQVQVSGRGVLQRIVVAVDENRERERPRRGEPRPRPPGRRSPAARCASGSSATCPRAAVLIECRSYCNRQRLHRSLGQQPPNPPPHVVDLNGTWPHVSQLSPASAR
jgi:hypothetical protein